jgi:hypothetical protein
MVFITPHIFKGRGQANPSKPIIQLSLDREQEALKPKSLASSKETEVNRMLSEFEKRRR